MVILGYVDMILETASQGGLNEVDYSAMFVSGGSDGKVQFWRDVTAEEEDKKVRLREETILLEQQLLNHMRNRNFMKVCSYREMKLGFFSNDSFGLKAFTLALDLGHPSKLLSIISAILDDEDGEESLNNKGLWRSS